MYSGTCQSCRHTLAALQLTNADFNYLSKALMSKVLVGNDIYNNSTPAELNDFKRFVEATQPYDVVIDGLNAAYAARGHGKTQINFGAEVIKQLALIFLNLYENLI